MRNSTLLLVSLGLVGISVLQILSYRGQERAARERLIQSAEMHRAIQSQVHPSPMPTTIPTEPQNESIGDYTLTFPADRQTLTFSLPEKDSEVDSYLTGRWINPSTTISQGPWISSWVDQANFSGCLLLELDKNHQGYLTECEEIEGYFEPIIETNRYTGNPRLKEERLFRWYYDLEDESVKFYFHNPIYLPIQHEEEGNLVYRIQHWHFRVLEGRNNQLTMVEYFPEYDHYMDPERSWSLELFSVLDEDQQIATELRELVEAEQRN